MFEFDFERLKVYRFAVDFYRKILRVTKILNRDLQFSLGDQLRRAALSIANNIAEGSGKESKKEKIYFFSTSVHSARECIPMITILFEEKAIDEKTHEDLRSDCRQITSMLRGLISSLR